mgnify:CR=1 FL=1
MAVMAEHENEPDATGPAIVRGIMIGVPVTLIGLTFAVWLITDLDRFPDNHSATIAELGS